MPGGREAVPDTIGVVKVHLVGRLPAESVMGHLGVVLFDVETDQLLELREAFECMKVQPLSWSELARARWAGEGDFIFAYGGVAVANMDHANVFGRSSAARSGAGPTVGPQNGIFPVHGPSSCRSFRETGSSDQVTPAWIAPNGLREQEYGYPNPGTHGMDHAPTTSKAPAFSPDIGYPDFIAGVQHQQLYSLLLHGVALLMNGLPDELLVAYRRSIEAADKTLKQLGADADALLTFRRAPDDLLSREEFEEKLKAEADSDELFKYASRNISALDHAMASIRETLPRENSARYTLGIHTASACFQTTMIVSLSHVFPADQAASLHETHANILERNAEFTRSNLKLYFGDRSPEYEKMPSYVQCALIFTELVERDRNVSHDTALKIIMLVRDLFDYLKHDALSIKTVLCLRILHDARTTRFSQEFTNHTTEPYCEAIRILQRYNLKANSADLDLAVTVAEQEADAHRDNALHHALHSNIFGGALWERFLRDGRLSDLNRAIAIADEALPQFLDTPAESSVRNNLGLALEHRFTVIDRNRSTIDRSIEELTKAVYPTFPLSEISQSWRHALGNALRTRYEAFDDINDLMSSITNLTLALQFTPDNSSDLALHRQSLAHALVNRYQKIGDRQDLDRAIELYELAVDGTVEHSPDLPKFLGALASAVQERYMLEEQPADLEYATTTYKRAMELGLDGSTGYALRYARCWGEWAFRRQSWEEAAIAFAYASDASDKLFSLQIGRQEKESWLHDIQGLAANAAYAQAMLGHPDRAVEILEHGLGRLISERLELDRVDLARLSELNRTDLVDRYRHVSERLSLFEAMTMASDVAVRGHARLAELQEARNQLDVVLSEIETVTGERLNSPLQFPDIVALGHERPIAYVAATIHGGMAVVLKGSTHDRISFVPLEHLTLSDLMDRVLRNRDANARFVEASRAYLTDNTAENRNAERKALGLWMTTIDETCKWIWQAIMQPVLSALGSVRHVIVIPAGLVALLPLHAAWEKNSNRPTGRSYACDDVVITYVPNARSLLSLRERQAMVSSPGITAVHSPAPSGQVALPLTKFEVQSAVRSFVSTVILEGTSATRERVLQVLQTSCVLHFSCHGFADLVDPVKSGLMLANDEALTLRDLLKTRLPQTELVVLSACETGVPGLTLPDEVISLSTGLLQAGASSVASTLWSVPDFSTALLIDRFYHLWRHEDVSPAEALHRAQKWVRDSKSSKLIGYYKQVLAVPAKFNTPPDTAKKFIKELSSLSASGADSRFFEAPLYWAPFFWAGKTS